MKFHVSLLVFSLLQLGTANNQELENESNLENKNKSESKAENLGLALDESERELAPIAYPASRPRPGQTQRYGSGRNFVRTFQNDRQPGANLSPPPQQGLRGQNRNQNRLQNFANGLNGRPNMSQIQQSANVQMFSNSLNGVMAPRNFVNSGPPPEGTGALIVGVPRDPNSLSQALGYLYVPRGSQIVYAQGEAVVLPTLPPVEASFSGSTNAPTFTKAPTKFPTPVPTKQPTVEPTNKPTNSPTKKPTNNPTTSPTRVPTRKPTNRPTRTPTKRPTKAPTKRPTTAPTKNMSSF